MRPYREFPEDLPMALTAVLIMAACYAVILAVTWVRAQRRAEAAGRSVPTTATVLSGHLVRRSTGGASYRPTVRYTVDGASYTAVPRQWDSDPRFSAGTDPDAPQEAMAGEQVEVFVDSQNPRRVYAQTPRGPMEEWWSLVKFLSLIVVGLTVFFIVVFAIID